MQGSEASEEFDGNRGPFAAQIPRRKVRRSLLAWGSLLTIALIIAGTALAGTTVVGKQTFPTITTPEQTNLVSQCTGTTLLTANVSWQFNSPSINAVTFNCTAAGWEPALFAAGPITDAPHFTLPTGYSDLYLVQASIATGAPLGPSATATGCNGFTGAIDLTNGQPLGIPSGDYGFDYCADYLSDGTTVTGFGITWT
jgi:hypothetical protein